MSIDKNRTDGSAKNVKGKAKETFGKAIGDQKTQADGKSDQAKGKAQNAAGAPKIKLRKIERARKAVFDNLRGGMELQLYHECHRHQSPLRDRSHLSMSRHLLDLDRLHVQPAFLKREVAVW